MKYDEIWWNDMKYAKINFNNSILEATRLRIQPATVLDNMVRCVWCHAWLIMNLAMDVLKKMAFWVQSKSVARSEIGDYMWRKYQEGPAHALVTHKDDWDNWITSPYAVRLDVNPIIRHWLVVGPPLWKIWTSIGMTIPNIWENKKCSKPPTRTCLSAPICYPFALL